jgi:hypothetical protein
MRVSLILSVPPLYHDSAAAAFARARKPVDDRQVENPIAADNGGVFFGADPRDAKSAADSMQQGRDPSPEAQSTDGRQGRKALEGRVEISPLIHVAPHSRLNDNLWLSPDSKAMQESRVAGRPSLRLPLIAEAAHQAGKREGDENGDSKHRVHECDPCSPFAFI